VLGLCKQSPTQALDAMRDFALEKNKISKEAVIAKLKERQAARDAKDFAKSDAVRDELAAMSIEVRDTPKGMEWKVVR
jgi:cysteinyl-tRNA synthetase